MRAIGRYWGYLLLVGLFAAWWSTDVGPIPLVILSILVVGYLLFQAPVWCGAEGRNGLCRNNAFGLFLGCHLRQHKWQKLKMSVVPKRWRELNRGLWTNPSTCLATVSTILGIISTAAALATSLLGIGAT